MIEVAPAVLTPQAVMAALADVADPEIPVVSIVDMGMVERVDTAGTTIEVELLPTFVGCPALDVIRDAVTERLGAFGVPVRVEFSFSTPWTSDRISPAGRERLRGSGFAPPPHLRDARALPMLGQAEPVACPYCGSANTTLENLFGPTQCRSIRHCADCRQPFEAFKAI